MELNEDGFLEELLAFGRETWEANPEMNNALFSNTWGGLNYFDATPVQTVLPASTYEDFALPIKPSLDCTFNDEMYSALEANFMPTPDLMTGSSQSDNNNYRNQLQTPLFPIHEDYSLFSIMEDDEPRIQAEKKNDHHNFEMQAATCKLEPSQSTDIPAFNMGLCMEHKNNKAKKPEGQPSKNLMAERRRRKRLNDRLSMLRSVVPKISKMDRTSILGDTIDYMKELLERISNLQEEVDVSSDQVSVMSILEDMKPNEGLVRNSPKFDVQRRNIDTRVLISCAAKPGLLLSTISALEQLGLEIQQCVISCFNDFSLQASCSEELEQRALISSEDVKQALFRNAGYGGSCL